MNGLDRKVRKIKDRRHKARKKKRQKAMYMAVLSHFKGDEWLTEFFVDIINRRLGGMSSTVDQEVWAPGTDGGVDWMRDMMKVHGLTKQEALNKARKEGVMRKVYLPRRNLLTDKQKRIFDKHAQKWRNEIKKLTRIMPNISKQWGGNTFSLKPKKGLIVRSGFTSKNDMEALESEFNVELDSESGKIISQKERREQKFGPKIDILQSMQKDVKSSGDDWTEDFLDSLISRAKKGKPFTDNQEEILFDKMYQYGYEDEIEEFGGDPDAGTSLEDEEKQSVLDELLEYAKNVNDEWLENFVRSVTRQISKGKELSDKQLEIIEENAEDAGISPDKIDLFNKESSVMGKGLKQTFHELIRIGNSNPDLREDISPILHHMRKAGRGLKEFKNSVWFG